MSRRGLADRLALHELVGLHGHLVDAGQFDRLGELFLPDVEYDVTAFGFGTLMGIDAIVAAAQALGAGNPLAHHVGNVIVTFTGDDSAQVLSKGIGVNPDGSVGSVTYEDEAVYTSAGWRIARRRVIPRREPLVP
jgi:SnoaL-like domain